MKGDPLYLEECTFKNFLISKKKIQLSFKKQVSFILQLYMHDQVKQKMQIIKNFFKVKTKYSNTVEAG